MLSHDDGMQLALAQAHLAEQLGEVPVGAVVLRGDQVVGAGHNQTISRCDPTAHAEVLALRAAAETLGNHRLDGCTLYVTLEPCAMCMGAIFHSRVAKLYFGAADPKTGACGSVLNLPDVHHINHHCKVHGGVLQVQCAQHLSAYFARLRGDKRQLARAPVREDALRLPSAALSGHMEGVQSLQLDDLEAAQGLRVQVWQNTAAPHNTPRLVLCLHGASSWSCIFHSLLTAPMDSNTAVWALDLPGHGGSDKTKKGQEFDTSYQLGVLDAVLQRSSAARIHVVAQDTGCALAVRMAAQHPARIDGLTLCNPLSEIRSQVLLQGAHVRSRAQFLASLQLQCPQQPGTLAALAAPYPDTGHVAGLLRQFNGASVGSPAPVFAATPAARAPRTVVHTSAAYFAEMVQFQARFGLTFECHQHPGACAYPGLGQPEIWHGVFALQPGQ